MSTPFSAQDREALAAVEAFLKSSGLSQAKLARMARVSSAALSQIRSGTYPSSPTAILASLSQAVAALKAATPEAQAVATSLFKLVHTACATARTYKNFAVVSAWVGTGKTFALKHYAAHHPNTVLIEATPVMTAHSITKLLARQLGLHEVRGGSEARYMAVIEALRGTDSLIVLDEADTLTAQQLHLLRRIRDLAGVGVVLAGTEHLTGLIKPEHGHYDQIRSRTGFWPAVVQGISQADTEALIAAHLGADVSTEVALRLARYAKGSARLLVEGLIAGIQAFGTGRELDVPLVDAVASQVLCLSRTS